MQRDPGVSTQEERNMFRDNWRRFMTRTSSVNAHDAVNFDDFAQWWEGEVKQLEARRKFASKIFRKTPALLKQYAKERARL